MRVIGQVASPGVKNTHQADLTANEAGIFCQLLSGSRGNPKEQVVKPALVAAHDFAQGRWQGESQHEIRYRQEQILLGCQPFLGFVVLALGTVTIAAGMVTVLRFAAGGTGVDLTAQGLSAALLISRGDLNRL